jgi:GT2 family glycosyltransferase
VTGDDPTIAVIVLAHGDEPYLGPCLQTVLASVDSDGRPLPISIRLVNNGSPAVAGLPADPRVEVLTPDRNLGFAGGCNFGVEGSTARTLVFVNSDALLAPEAVYRLAAELRDDTVGLVSGGVRLATQPESMNTVGNPVHYLGLVWAGGYGEPASQHRRTTDIASVTGAFFATRAATWHTLGGFDERYFAYHEDADLSLRCWQAGYRVRFVPEAVAWHHYEFSRTPTKQYLLERNRWITLLTDFPAPLLAAIAIPLAAFEIAVAAAAVRQGWFADKLRSYRWLLRHRSYLRARRARVRGANRISTREFASLLSARIEPAILGPIPGLWVANAALAAYWKICRRALAVSGTGRETLNPASSQGR